MAITYTWKIDMMHTQSRSGVVQNAITEIHWSKTGTDETGTVGRYPGCTKFNLDEIIALNTSGNFTQLENLTEEQVIGWIQGTISSDDMTFIDSQIQASITHQKTPKNGGSVEPKNFPWATN